MSCPLTPDTARSGNSVHQISHSTAVPTRLPPAPGYSGFVDASGALHSVVEHVMTYAFGVLCIVNFYLAVREFGLATLIAALIVAGPIAWVLADFVSGLIHWFADTYGSENTPLFGPWLIKPFRQHHLYPRDICTHDLVLTIGNSSTIAMPLESGLLYLMLSDEEITLTQALVAFVLNLFAMAMVATNLFHRWAHAERVNWLISRLQSSRFLLNPSHHDLHHTKPFDSNYCITNGWLNPVLEKARFFRRLESMLSSVGIRPNAGEYQTARSVSDHSR